MKVLDWKNSFFESCFENSVSFEVRSVVLGAEGKFSNTVVVFGVFISGVVSTALNASRFVMTIIQHVHRINSCDIVMSHVSPYMVPQLIFKY
jgi:hypothetical protein